MKVRILENVKTSLTEEEIVITEVKPLPKEVETNSNHKNVFLAFLKEQVPLLSDKDLYLLYKTYRNEEFAAYVDENLEDYNKYSEYAEILKSEILNRIDSEC